MGRVQVRFPPHLNFPFHSFWTAAIDTMKTVLQVDSAEGFRGLMRRLKAGRIDVLYQGAMATAVSSILGHYPWVRRLHMHALVYLYYIGLD